jgi:hypothetical protein
MPGQSLLQAFGRIVIFDLAHNERVIADDYRFTERNISLRSSGLLVLEGVPDQKPIERFTAAIERFKRMEARKLLNPEGMSHTTPPRSNILGSRKSLARRGAG